jgi:hypothetical protein
MKILFSFLFLIAKISSQINHNDGPYVFINNNKLIEKNIINDKVVSSVLLKAPYDTLYPPENPLTKMYQILPH